MVLHVTGGAPTSLAGLYRVRGLWGNRLFPGDISRKINGLVSYQKRCRTSAYPTKTPIMDDCCQKLPLFTFGVIADVQYADIDDGFNYSKTRRRYYRSSLQLLRNSQKSWLESTDRPEFILQLGDVIDGFNKGRDASERALDSVLTEFSSSLLEVHHVWGNHEFYNFSRSALLRSRLNSTLHTDRSYSGAQAGGEIYAYHFSPFPGFTFVVLDAYDVSMLGREESSDQYNSALSLIKQYNKNEELNCPPGMLLCSH